MADDSYTIASGESLYAGWPSPTQSYGWAALLTADAWTELAGTDFRTWALANIPAGAYQGTDPFDSIVNAYCDPSHDPVTGRQYFFGGGHGDGTCNAVVAFDHATLGYSLSGSPTPPSKYPPTYYNGGHTQPGPLTYPSGLSGAGFFLPSSMLSASEDMPYAAPQLARASSHMYAAAASRGATTHYFYLTYAEFDAATGQWSGHGVDLGAQLITYRPQYNNQPLQQGTVAIYDEVTDRFFLTLCPGDNGGAWRSGMVVFNPTTRLIESIHETNAGTYGLVLESMSLVRVNRKLYGFTKVSAGFDQPQVMSQGFIFDMDSKTYSKFVLTGDLAGTTYSPGATQETIPAYYDGIAIRRWNYSSSTRGTIYSVNLTPSSGTGTVADPYVLQQTGRAVAGSGAMDPIYVYSRLVWCAAAQCALVIPRATQNWRALKLS